MSRVRQLPRVRVLVSAIIALHGGGTGALAMEARSAAPPDVEVAGAEPPSTTPVPADEKLTAAAVAHASTAPPPSEPPAPTPVPPAPAPPAPTPPPTAAPPTAAPAGGTATVAAPPNDPLARVHASFEAAVPADWRAAVAVRFVIIDGNTSWAVSDGTIEVARSHASSPDPQLRALVAHEFGHLIAYRYGSQAFDGAPPDGWPSAGARPEESWADCVSRAFTAVDDPSHGLPSCTGEPLRWTAWWLSAGPAAHRPTD